VVVENVTTGSTAVFPAGKDGAPGGRWFADNDDDRKCRRLLTARSTSEFVYTVRGCPPSMSSLALSAAPFGSAFA